MKKPNGTNLAMYGATVGLWGRREIERDVDDLIDKLAWELCEFGLKRVEEAGEFHLALSGGTTPERLFTRLMIDPRFRVLPWTKTHLWQVDDRCVPMEDERSNARMLRELLIDHSGIPANQAHLMAVLEERGDERYERELREQVGKGKVGERLDFVLLGMGGDGHTASLFPGSPALGERERWVVFNDGERVVEPRPRMTMTYPVVNGARKIGVLVTGAGKHEMLRKVAQAAESGVGDALELPILGVRPSEEDGVLTWYLDGEAAAGARE